MLSKQEHIDYWVKSSEDDWEAVNALLTSKKYAQCLFFAHLVLEKLCKSHWVKDNEGNIIYTQKLLERVKIIKSCLQEKK